jgi:murein L,D-transpeptidase YcbB/YkuD
VTARWPPPRFVAAVVIARLLGAAAGEAQDPARHEVDLRQSVARYRTIAAAGGWGAIPRAPALESGTRDHRVIVLRRRLEAEGYPASAAVPDPELYDADLVEAVKLFQRLHGLEEDGVTGPATMAALNVPAEARVGQIEANLAPGRQPWIDSSGRYVVVNVAAFSLDLVEDGRSILRLRTIVGRRDWPTPTASSRITAVVFRPVWRIPTSIAVREILPIVRRDPGYFERTGTRVFRRSAGALAELDPEAVDWRAVRAEGFGYRLQQEPGPRNPLGGVKLVFRTRYDVYLHDTPNRALFAKARRTFSHGCVRVEGIDRLVAYLLPDWPADSISAAMAVGRDRRVELGAPIPIHLVYWTAWTESDGRVAFRDDVYRRDRRGSSQPRRGTPASRQSLSDSARRSRA